MTIAEWIGTFQPDKLKLIPLLEDKDALLNSDKIIEGYLSHENVEDYQRVWLARSDPALNYGDIATVRMLKVALHKLGRLQENLSIDLLPILGCGSAPFRGNFKPTNIKTCIKDYPSVYTYTLQSAFKYDYPIKDVVNAVEFLNESKSGKPLDVDEEKFIPIIEKVMGEYQKQVALLEPLIHEMSPYIPPRRKRKLHIGLFGYSRSVSGMKLPRAITFCASLYSYGLPPEILGLNALTENDIDFIKEFYPNFDNHLKDSLQHLNDGNLKIFPHEIIKAVESASKLVDFEVNEDHRKITSIIMANLKHKDHKLITENVTRAGFVRGFLG